MRFDIPEIAGLDPEIVILLGGLVLLVLLIVVMALLSGDPKRKSLQRRIEQVRKSGKSRGGESLEFASAKRRTQDSDIALFDQLIKTALPRREELRKRLARAGLQITLGRYLVICLVAGVIVFLLAALSQMVPLAGSAFAGLFGAIGLPYMIVGFLGSRRRNKFIALFPEAIDLMVRGLKSGLPISESVKNAGNEVADPVGTELRGVTDAMRMGKKLEDMLWETAKRLDIQEFNFFTVSLAIQSETGGNLAETLENLSNVLRGRRQLKLKIKALSSEAKASAYIIGSLPFVMGVLIYMVNPGYIMDLFIDPRGHFLIGLGLTSFVIGAGVMYKMVKFDV
jgi:tight adherence protein B